MQEFRTVNTYNTVIEACSGGANKVNEIIDVFNSGYEDIINQNIDKYFNNIMIDAMYDGSRETLILKKEISSTGDIHVYRENTKTIEVV